MKLPVCVTFLDRLYDIQKPKFPSVILVLSWELLSFPSITNALVLACYALKKKILRKHNHKPMFIL